MSSLQRFLIDRFDTPLGELAIVVNDDGQLCAVNWTDHEAHLTRELNRYYGAGTLALEPAKNPGGLTVAMKAYFAGDLRAIDELPVATPGTDFQRIVWRALREIPCGRTMSYSELASTIGRPSAVRAVGLANGANPIGIVVPCHRVIGANGTLTGYGGGIERKRWLLQHEGAYQPLISDSLSIA
jgi:methylated-DNA-[protein]-cysteine S-methyltransferase